MKTSLLTVGLLLVASLTCVPAMAIEATSFSDPTAWNVGDTNSTYNEWDLFTVSSGNTPDVGTNYGSPTVDVTYPGYPSGSFNFYSHASDYAAFAVVDTPSVVGKGTRVKVQTASTVGMVGALMSGLSIFDDSDNLLSDTPYSELELFFGTVSSSYGPVTQKESAYSFWLPGYTGNIKLSWNNPIHSSFMGLRVDTLATSQDPTAVPEPSTAGLLLLGFAGLGFTALRRRKR